MLPLSRISRREIRLATNRVSGKPFTFLGRLVVYICFFRVIFPHTFDFKTSSLGCRCALVILLDRSWRKQIAAVDNMMAKLASNRCACGSASALMDAPKCTSDICCLHRAFFKLVSWSATSQGSGVTPSHISFEGGHIASFPSTHTKMRIRKSLLFMTRSWID